MIQGKSEIRSCAYCSVVFNSKLTSYYHNGIPFCSVNCVLEKEQNNKVNKDDAE